MLQRGEDRKKEKRGRRVRKGEQEVKGEGARVRTSGT